MSIMQLDASRAERMLVNGCNIVTDAISHFAEIVEKMGVSRGEKDEIDALRKAYEAAQKNYCCKLTECAAKAGLVVSVAGDDVE